MANTADDADTSGDMENIFWPIGWFQKNISSTSIPICRTATKMTKQLLTSFKD
jgi:hypothetical protein